MDSWKRLDGTLVLDFTDLVVDEAPAAFRASSRQTTSSRAPGQIRKGTVYSRNVRAKRCPDCGHVCDGATVPGRHAPRAAGGRMINCVGQRIEVWP